MENETIVCKICGDKIKLVSVEKGFEAEGICKETGGKHVFTFEDVRKLEELRSNAGKKLTSSVDQAAENISRNAKDLARIEADVGKLLVEEVDKLNLSGGEKMFACTLILTNIIVTVGKGMKGDFS